MYWSLLLISTHTSSSRRLTWATTIVFFLENWSEWLIFSVLLLLQGDYHISERVLGEILHEDLAGRPMVIAVIPPWLEDHCGPPTLIGLFSVLTYVTVSIPNIFHVIPSTKNTSAPLPRHLLFGVTIFYYISHFFTNHMPIWLFGHYIAWAIN